jgi:hypothetical protein
MHDSTKHELHAGTPLDDDPERRPGAGRKRGDDGPDGGPVNPGPPQRGYGDPGAGGSGRSRGDDQPDGGGVNPGPPQRGYGEAQPGGHPGKR